MKSINNYFGFKRSPFSANIPVDKLYQFEAMVSINENIQFAVEQNMNYVIIGDVGAGKSTALYYANSMLPKKHYHVINTIGGSYSFSEFLRSILYSFDDGIRTSQQTTLLKFISTNLRSVIAEGKLPVLCIDEAHLLENKVFSQLHLLNQIYNDNSKILPIILCGQESLFEKVHSISSKPFFSRVIDGFNLGALTQVETTAYIKHHINVIAGCNQELFDDKALIAIHQCSAGLPRNINALCLKALKYCMDNSQKQVCTDNVKNISKDWWNK